MLGSAAAAGKGSMRTLCGRRLVQALAAHERLGAVAGFSGRTAVLHQVQQRRHAYTGKRGSLQPVQARVACVSRNQFPCSSCCLLVLVRCVMSW